MNILKELYYGNVRPNEKRFDQPSEYAKFVKILSGNEQKLTAFFSTLPNAQEQQHLFSQMITAQSEISSFNELDRFLEGFQLGARIMLDTFILPHDSVVRDIV